MSIAAIQPSILNRERKTETGRANCRNRLQKLTELAAGKGADFVVWPETALQNFRHRPDLQLWVKEIINKNRISLLTGASEFLKFHHEKEPGQNKEKSVYRSYNSAFFITASGVILPPYHKIILVPFGEYIPLRAFLHWPQWLVPDFTETSSDDSATLFKLSEKIQFAPVICWENLFAGFVRDKVNRGAGLIVQISNDNLFGRTAASKQHNLSSVMRAVENQTPVVISSNTGPSQIIDEYGRVVSRSTALFTRTMIMASIKTSRHTQTFYTRYGDLFAWICTIFVLLRILSGIDACYRNC